MGLAISAAAFYIFTSVFALEIVNTSKWKVVTVAFALTFLLMGSSDLHTAMPELAEYFAALGLYLAVVFTAGMLALKFWLKATWPQSVKIAGSYVGANVAYSLAFGVIAYLAGDKSV